MIERKIINKLISVASLPAISALKSERFAVYSFKRDTICIRRSHLASPSPCGILVRDGWVYFVEKWAAKSPFGDKGTKEGGTIST